jgi:general secretion pathway protein C
MDGIMKIEFKSFINTLFISIVIFVSVKLLWVLVESFMLPKSGINHKNDILSKNLYYHIKLVKQSYNKPKPIIKKPVASIKDIKLIALYTDSDIVVITIVYKNKTKILSKGGVVNGFKLIGGTNNYALFEKNNKRYRVDLSIKNLAQNISGVQTKTTPLISSNANTNQSIVDVGDHKIIDKKLFDHFANNMDDIYKNIGIKEVQKGQKKEFKVSFIKRGSAFAKLGIKRGDVIKAINGQEIDSYSTAFNAYRQVKDADSLSVVVIRNNKEVELEYEIN